MRIHLVNNSDELQKLCKKYQSNEWSHTLETSSIKCSRNIKGLKRVGLLCAYSLLYVFTFGGKLAHDELKDIWSLKRVVLISCPSINEEIISNIFKTLHCQKTNRDQINEQPVACPLTLCKEIGTHTSTPIENLTTKPIDINQEKELSNKFNELPKPNNSILSKKVIDDTTIKLELTKKAAQRPHSEKLILFKSNSKIPYYLHRRGFPNPSAENCPYNSLAVVHAHTGGAITVTIHKDNQLLFKESQTTNADTFVDALKTTLQDYRSRLEPIEIEITKNLDKSLSSKIRKTEVLSQEIDRHELNYQQICQHLLDIELQKNNLDSVKKEVDEQISQLNVNRSLMAEPEYLKNQLFINETVLLFEINAFRLLNKSAALKSEASEALAKLKQKKEELVNILKPNLHLANQDPNFIKAQQLKKSIEVYENAINRQKELDRSKQVLAILRGDIEGTLTERDAQILCENIDDAIDPNDQLALYKGSTEVKADITREKLLAAINDPHWRVVRIGGHGHWWTCVRHVDGITVDEINDTRITKSVMTIEQIYEKFKDPNQWLNEQIAFY